MKLVPDIYSVDDLLELVDRGRMALPQFQRDFVWRPAHVVDLLHTVAKRWPAGNFLLLEGPQDFAVRPIDAGPRLTTSELLILDGQQRMTALYQAFRNEGSEVYYVDFEPLLRPEPESDEFVLYERRTTFEKRYPSIKAMAEASLAPVSLIADDAQFFEWLGHLPLSVREQSLGLRSTTLSGLRAYDIPVVRLPRDVEMEALAKIFETINRTGVRLATFDLMVARLYPHQFNLAEEWETARGEQGSLLAAFKVDGIDILKLIALLAHLDERREGHRPFKVKGIRESDVLALPAELIKRKWLTAIVSYVSALEALRREFGVIGPTLLPSSAMVLPMAAALVWDVPSARLSSWFWRCILSQSYAQAANTQAVADAISLIRGEEESRPTRDRLPDVEVLFDSRRRNDILVKGLLARVVRDGALDPVTDRPLRGMDTPFAIRRIFPRRYVADRGGEPDSLINLMIVSDGLRGRSTEALPSEYLSIASGQGEQWSRDALESQLCSVDALSSDSYGEFAQSRARAWYQLVQEASVLT